MRKILYVFLLLTLASCSNNDDECEDLYNQYIESLGFTGGSQAAVDEVTRQYNERKAELGCD